MDNNSEKYEKLCKNIVAALLEEGCGEEKIHVKHNSRLKGKSGVTHQIDVYARYERDGKTYDIIIDAKNWNKRVSKGEVFKMKCVRDDLPRKVTGIVVSKNGYQKGAKKFADYYGIGVYCLAPSLDSIKLSLTIPSISAKDVVIVFDEKWNFQYAEQCNIPKEVVSTLMSTYRNLQFLPLLYSDESTQEEGFIGAAVDVIVQYYRETVDKGNMTVDENSTPITCQFTKPVFIETDDKRFPRLKISALEGNVSRSTYTKNLPPITSKFYIEGFVRYLLKYAGSSKSMEERFGKTHVFRESSKTGKITKTYTTR